LSTLTKILIVLLTLSSICLCGIVATYVANADNYQQKYKNLKDERDSLSKKVEDLTKQVNENLEQKKQLENNLNSEITSLKAEKSELQTKLDNSEREKAELLQKVNSWTSITKDFYETNDKQGQLLKNTLDELNKLQTEQARQRKELDETTKALDEKMAIIETLQTENKRMQEEKAELQNKLDKFLQPIGKTAAATVPVTPKKEAIQPATTETAVRDIALQGTITAMDLKNSMATISIGTADGVKEGMRFHVTRGNEFLCDILIIDVDAKEAVGALELVQQQPNVGDTVSTNL
jgi:cysteine sulfinate desulfinase/cysteine desulfurase-like protein